MLLKDINFKLNNSKIKSQIYEYFMKDYVMLDNFMRV
jgi:hypothetical protein